nr:uncharacterized protein LOC107446016 [Parasteatoda tepidariorum]
MRSRCSLSNSIGCVIGSVLKDNPNISGSVVNASMEMKGTLSCHANNMMACTFLEDPIYKDYLGFTVTEVEELLKKPLLQKLNKVDLQEFYDGYKVLNFNIKIYNTYSIVMYLNQWIRHMKMKHKEKESPKSDDCKPKKYWVDRGINLSKVLRITKLLEMAVVLCGSGTATVQAIENKMTICHLLSLRKLLSEPDDVVLNDELVALFFHFLKNCGYLCITEETANTITLSVPNKEIQISLIRDIFYSGLCAKLYRLDHKKYINALKKLDMDAESTFQDFANSIVSMFPQKSWAKTQDELKGIMFAFAFKDDMFSKVESECHVVPERRFRADLVIIKKDGIGVTVEIASGNDSEEEALQKIFDKQYFKALPDSIEQKIYIGLQFNYSIGSANICSKVTSGKTPNTEITAAKFNEFKIIHCSARRND